MTTLLIAAGEWRRPLICRTAEAQPEVANVMGHVEQPTAN